METSKIGQNHDRLRWQEAMRPPKRPSSRALECGCFDRTAWDLPLDGHKATTGGDEAGSQLRTVDLSDLSPTPVVEERKSEVRRNSTTIGSAGPLLGSAAKWTGIKKGNSRFVHARTNHVQRKNDTGRATWALISLAFTEHHACLSLPTRERGSWHPNQS